MIETQHKREKEKQYIIHAALTLFRQHGIRYVSVERLTKEVHVSRRKLYQLFGDKKGLLKACLAQHYAEEKAQAIELREQARDEIEYFLMSGKVVIERELKLNVNFYYDLLHFYPDLRAAAIQHNESFNSMLVEQNLRSGKENGLFREELDTEMVAKVLILLYESILQKELYRQFECEAGKFVDRAIQPYVRGICTEKGLDLLVQYEQQMDAITI